jgi:hypothetical protein
MALAEVLQVEVAYSAAPGQLERVALQLAPGATVGSALQASGFLQAHGLKAEDLRCGIWGKPKPLDCALRTLDRVEIYRPLRVDPKEARRQRYRKNKPARAAARA